MNSISGVKLGQTPKYGTLG